jgi:aspartate aminotransferase
MSPRGTTEFMPQLNKTLQHFQHSAIQEVFSLAGQLKAEGREIIDLSVGEPDFCTPAHIKQAGIEAIRSDVTRYTSCEGTDALKQAISAKLKRDNDLNYGFDQIVVDCGVKPMLFHTLLALLDVGNEVIVPTPCWTSYLGMIHLLRAKPVFVRCPQENGFKLKAADLEAAITENTRLIMLNSPSNPTGAAYNSAEMKELTDVLLRYPNVWVLADDIYEHIVFDGFIHANPAQIEPRLYDRTVTLNGVSKAYAMTGWRIGYAAGPDRLIRALVKVLSQATGCASAMGQAAAIAALNGPQEFLEDWVQIYQQRRDYVISRLNRMPGLTCHAPEGAFYLYPSCHGVLGKKSADGRVLDSSVDFAKHLLHVCGVAVIPGSAFEFDPHIRISYASSMEALEQACDHIEKACNNIE